MKYHLRDSFKTTSAMERVIYIPQNLDKGNTLKIKFQNILKLFKADFRSQRREVREKYNSGTEKVSANFLKSIF